MTDGADELRQSLEHLIEQRIGAMTAAYGTEPGSRLVAPTNPHAGGVDTAQEASFSTGYDSGTGLTTLAFTWDISEWDDADVWTAP